ncbi:MAG: hypothetical protein GY772_23060, partial [bacterium]|nr:hypothetical protein [bacterium]
MPPPPAAAAPAAKAAVEVEREGVSGVVRVLMEAMVQLAAASVPPVETILHTNPSQLFDPTYVQGHLGKWSQRVSQAMQNMRAAAGGLNQDDPEVEALLAHLGMHAKVLSSLRTKFEFLAQMTKIINRHNKRLVASGDLQLGHETLAAGYTASAGARRVVLRHQDVMQILTNMLSQDALIEVMIERDHWLIPHALVRSIMWQLRLGTPPKKPEFVPSKDMLGPKSQPPEYWRILMVEVNNDILDASRRVVFHGVAMGQSLAEAVPNFKGFLADMKEFLDFRASVIRGMGLTGTASFEDVQLPWYTPGTVDCADVPVIF